MLLIVASAWHLLELFPQKSLQLIKKIGGRNKYKNWWIAVDNFGTLYYCCPICDDAIFLQRDSILVDEFLTEIKNHKLYECFALDEAVK